MHSLVYIGKTKKWVVYFESGKPEYDEYNIPGLEYNNFLDAACAVNFLNGGSGNCLVPQSMRDK